MAATGEALKPSELTVLSWGDHLYRPCVDSGRRAGNFCETLLQAGHARWQGGSCLAEVSFPSGDEEGGWSCSQRTPLCTACEKKHGACHGCRKVPWCRPFAFGARQPAAGDGQL